MIILQLVRFPHIVQIQSCLTIHLTEIDSYLSRDMTFTHDQSPVGTVDFAGIDSTKS